jgi:PAS domain S-box-containing protein
MTSGNVPEQNSAAEALDKHQEAHLKELRMLRALIDNLPDFLYAKDANSRFVIANMAVATNAGTQTPGDLVGKTDFDLFPKELAQNYYEDEQKIIRSGQPLLNREEQCVDPHGNVHYLLSTKVPFRDENGRINGIVGVGRDITKRRKVEEDLREAEQRFRSIFEETIVGVFQGTPSGRYLSVNPAMARIFGYESPEEMVRTVTDVSQTYVEPKKYMELILLLDRMGAVRNFECQVYRKDRSQIWLSLNAHAVRKDGVLVRYDGMIEDTTERKALHQQLLQAQKLESIGQLAAGIAHEINTPTQYIGDNVRFLKDAFTDLTSLIAEYGKVLATVKENAALAETLKESLNAIDRVDKDFLLNEIPNAIDQGLEGVTRVATLVSAMKEFSHPGTKEKSPVNLNKAIESTITVARNEWKYVADMETDFDQTLPAIPCLPGEVNQVILNLIVNAAHAIGDVVAKGGTKKGKIRIQTRNCEDWVEIRIQDSGTGIPKHVQARVFDPFFTTKEVGKGTGQGLAIARSVVVDKHDGSIHFETEEGKGTTFIICLPFDGKAVAAHSGV